MSDRPANEQLVLEIVEDVYDMLVQEDDLGHLGDHVASMLYQARLLVPEGSDWQSEIRCRTHNTPPSPDCTERCDIGPMRRVVSPWEPWV